MYRADRAPQLTFLETFLAAEMALSPTLAYWDERLDDPAVLAPLAPHFSVRRGRPTIPMATFVRLSVLRRLYDVGDEALCEEVRHNLQWRRFCHIPLHASVPHPTTLVKLRQKLGPTVVHALNDVLTQQAQQRHLVQGRRWRQDTTVVESDIHYPTDSRLLEDGVRQVTRIVRRLAAAGVVAAQGFRDRGRSIHHRILQIAKVSRRRTDAARQDVRDLTAAIADRAQATLRAAQQVWETVQAAVVAAGAAADARLVRGRDRLLAATDVLGTVLTQTRQVVARQTHLPDRVVSVFDPTARPIVKGKVGKPVEFGYKVAIDEVDDGFIVGWETAVGNRPDIRFLPPALQRHRRLFRRTPREAAMDRGYWDRDTVADLEQARIYVAIPKRGKKSAARQAVERQTRFRRLQRWRAGGEGRIGLVKRRYQVRRSRYRGESGTDWWVGMGILAANLEWMRRQEARTRAAG
ncbi:MAG: ISNCY family transposase [Thermaerobacter sp.]|nr:ISNCY family transposase [Thermaerobacter sp.]